MPDPSHAHARRGAAFTFNAPVFVECMRRLHDPAWQDRSIPFPGFDHDGGDPVQDAVWVHASHRLVVCEGLYVLRGDVSDHSYLMSCSAHPCGNGPQQLKS